MYGLIEMVSSNLWSHQLRLGLDYSYIDKNKNTRKFLAANSETLAQRTSDSVEAHRLEKYHEFLRGYTDIFTKNVFQTKDYTHHNLKKSILEKDVVFMKGYKDSSVVILNKPDYIEKLENMVKEGIEGTYTLTEDNTIKDLQNFKEFLKLKRNFKGYDKLDDMLPTSNQPASTYSTAKTHKFSSVDSVNINDLKFRPIIDQTGTMTCDAAKVISDYLRPLFKNKHTINDTLSFADMVKRLPPLPDNEEYVSYDVVALVTNIPLDETIDYIIESIYTHKKLPQICSKLVFRWLIEKITIDCTFQLCFINK